MKRTERALKVAQYAGENFIRNLLHHLDYPSTFSMKVEIKAGELYFSKATEGLNVSISENALIGFPSFQTVGMFIPEFDGVYLLRNLVVKYGHSLSEPTIISFGDESQIELINKAEKTLNLRYGLL